jgi:formate-dependent phosphoribosylglycinamide formyltransferase (GAR transformylase)
LTIAPGLLDRLLLLIPTTSYRVGDFLAAARGLDVRVTVGSDRRQVLEAYSQGGTVTLDFGDLERGTAQIVDFARDHRLRAVVATDEETTRLAARASEALGLPHNPVAAVEAATDKLRFRQALAAAGLPSPAFTPLSLDDDPAEAAGRVAYPCVLKPLSLSASRGVIRADDPASFAAAFRRIEALLDSLPGAGRDLIVEGFVPGPEVALEGLLIGGRLHLLALFDKPDPLDGPFFEESLYVTPSRLPAAAQDAVADATAAAVGALGLREGPIHAELRLGAAMPVPVEVAPRSIGGLCARTLRFGAGIRLEELILRHALALPIETLEREARPVGVMMIPIPRAGRLAQVGGLEAARGVAGIEEVTITIPLGQTVVPLPEGNRYLGFIFARAETPEAVEAALREAHRRLDFVIEGEPGGAPPPER